MIYAELATVVALIFVNGLLAMAELAVVSSRRSRLQALASQGVTGSRRALALAADPGKFLSSVQIGITLVGVLSGAFSGATLGVRLGGWLTSLGMSANVADIVSVGVVVTAITYASLIVGELVPKQIALRNPERVAVRVAPAMTVLARIASPLVWLLNASGRLILLLLGHSGSNDQTVTEEEIRTLVSEAETAGVIETGERDMITSVMRFGDRGVRALMTPRHDVDMIDLTADPDDIRKLIFESVHSRLPAYEGTPDAMIGIVQAKDMLDALLNGDDPDIRSLIRPAPNLPDTADALAVLQAIKNSAVHMALVHDEYGNFEGVVTNADILEAIVGEFRTDEGPAEPDAVRRDDGSWLISGSMPADEMAESLGIALPASRPYHTAAGFVLDKFGNLPQVGDVFDAAGWRFEVVDLDGRRIDKILVRRMTARRRA
ncbi:MAG TPA: hemolysin family protein [Xanthobacteraceae bacterium]|nr:hemolysin family protein [Xanthobacteraceae bacterium]